MSSALDSQRKKEFAPPAYLLPVLLVSGAAFGFAIGGFFGEYWISGEQAFLTGVMRLFGDVFMNILKMLVVPLIVCSMILGMTSIGEHKKIGKIFLIAFAYYAVTTLAAVIQGLFGVLLIRPGVGSQTAPSNGSDLSVDPLSWYDALFNMIRGLFPENLIAAAAEGQILGLIVFSIIFGGLLTTFGDRAKRLIEIIEVINEVLMVFVRWVIWLAPLGILGLVADRVGQAGGGSAVWQELTRLGWYFVTVVCVLAFHAFVVLPIILRVMTGRSPFKQMGQFAEAIVTAFSTASSAATLPITIKEATQNAGMSERSARFVLPLGATINMDGTALYEAVAAVFIAQAYGIDLNFAQIVVIALTSTLAAIGAAAIPQAGLVTMAMVLSAVGIPLEGIGLLLSVDWLLDRFRTAVNVWGDTIGTAIVDKKISD